MIEGVENQHYQNTAIIPSKSITYLQENLSKHMLQKFNQDVRLKKILQIKRVWNFTNVARVYGHDGIQNITQQQLQCLSYLRQDPEIYQLEICVNVPSSTLKVISQIPFARLEVLKLRLKDQVYSIQPICRILMPFIMEIQIDFHVIQSMKPLRKLIFCQMLTKLKLNFSHDMWYLSQMQLTDVFEDLHLQAVDKKRDFIKADFLKMKIEKPFQKQKLSLFGNLCVNPFVMMRMIDKKNIKLY